MKKTTAISYVTFTKNKKEFQKELLSHLKVLGQIFLPKTKYRISVYGNEIMPPTIEEYNEENQSKIMNGYDHQEKITIEVSSEILQKYIRNKIQLRELWNNMKFFKKEAHIHNIQIISSNIPLLITD